MYTGLVNACVCCGLVHHVVGGLVAVFTASMIVSFMMMVVGVHRLFGMDERVFLGWSTLLLPVFSGVCWLIRYVFGAEIKAGLALAAEEHDAFRQDVIKKEKEVYVHFGLKV